MNDLPSASPEPSAPSAERSGSPPATPDAASFPTSSVPETVSREPAPPLPTPDGNLNRPIAPSSNYAGAHAGHYAPLRGKAKAVLTLLGIGIALDVIAMLSTLAQLSMLSRVAAGQGLSEAEATANDLRQGLIALGQLGVFLATAVLFLMWMYRAHRNLKPLGAEGLQFTSGWAVGYFFVPIINLVRPFEAMSEIWKGSDPETAPGDALGWKTRPVAPLIGWWWGIYLISNIFSWIVMRATMDSKEIPELISSSKLELADAPVSIASALLAMAVVRAITDRQEARLQRLNAPATLSGAPPMQNATPFNT